LDTYATFNLTLLDYPIMWAYRRFAIWRTTSTHEWSL